MKFLIEHEERNTYQRVLTMVEAESIPDAIEKVMDKYHWVGANDIFSAKQYLEVKALK